MEEETEPSARVKVLGDHAQVIIITVVWLCTCRPKKAASEMKARAANGAPRAAVAA